MKKIIALLIISLFVTGCINSTYSVKFVDMKSPADTVEVEFIVRECAAHSTNFYVGCRKEPNMNLYRIVGDAGLLYNFLYTSSYPIYIIDYSYIENDK